MVQLRITYASYSELRRDVTEQMARGGVLVRIDRIADLHLHTPIMLELVLPDGERLSSTGQVLQQLPGFGVAVTVEPGVVEILKQCTGVDHANVVAAQHQRVEDGAPTAEPTEPNDSSPRPASIRPAVESLTHAQKIHMAMHGNRDERNAILRDTNRSLHPFVLKNPQLGADDVLEICKNALTSPVLLKLISDRKEWFQRPAIALGLARNPKTPPDVAVRALAHVSIDALRIMAKGSGVLPHVAQAARKKILG